MKAVNIRQLHEHTGSLVDLAAEGHPVVILRRGVPVAELGPAPAAGRGRTLPDRHALLARYPRLRGDSGRFLEAERS
jgi:antitoxin (DNA-binding transcriptional repressor) of toxin-antitoxin stability system